ncbi:MAG TPA: type VI secretion system protein TssA [Deltaproteobacteria bacterium]|nr:type VI secretion system protein TssA [Deltaproteobacteria bacterium]HPP80959.1 type VI secretion system protein TssA [Deltaproteobacteria bacterium]
MAGRTPEVELLLKPIDGGNPSGGDLRYSEVYDRIKEARRADDMLNQGDWQREPKRADWALVVETAREALATKTKDLQLAVWLTEGLMRRQGFEGLACGLDLLAGLLENFWDTLYPLAEDGDLEYRSAPLEFLNDKLSLVVREIPLTDSGPAEGFSWNRWQESRQVGYEKDTKNQWGDTDENKMRLRQEQLAEGRIAAETFDEAVARSSREFYIRLSDSIDATLEAFGRLDRVVDERFGNEAPKLSDLKKAIEDCSRLVAQFLKDKGGKDDPGRREARQGEDAAAGQRQQPVQGGTGRKAQAVRAQAQAGSDGMGVQPAAPFQVFSDSASQEEALWQAARQTLEAGGINAALAQLLAASASAPSPRQKNRYRLLMAKLALTANRPDIARPIVEELYGLISELNLERWESPLWIAEVIEAYYLCLTGEGASEEDRARADNELFPKLCSLDITKALAYKKGG